MALVQPIFVFVIYVNVRLSCTYVNVRFTQIMMLKLRGHPPILMKKHDGEGETQLSSQLSKVRLGVHVVQSYEKVKPSALKCMLPSVHYTLGTCIYLRLGVV